jgi:hypothetical protein
LGEDFGGASFKEELTGERRRVLPEEGKEEQSLVVWTFSRGLEQQGAGLRPAKERNQQLMNKKHVLVSLALGAMVATFTSSKEESKTNIYLPELETLCEESLVGGGQISEDSLRGKMLILNFWASYDPMSRINSYQLVRLGGLYGEKKFEGGNGLQVVCISMDTYKSAMQKAIEADGTEEFFHICDLQGEESPIARKFDVNRPVNLLVSADGKILARDFGTDMIEGVLSILAQ